MKKLLIFLLAGALVLPVGVLAATNDFSTDSDITVNLSGLDIDLTVKSGASVSSMTSDTNTIQITTANANSTIRIESANRYTISTTGFSNATFTCPTSGNSYLVINGTASGETGSVSAAKTECQTPTSNNGGGGGGGGGYVPPPAVIIPSNPSISIASGAAETNASEVSLSLGATNATQMMISNKSNFDGAAWETYSTTKTWTLASGLGKKTVYAKFKSSTGGESSTVNASIMLLPASAVKNITASAGGHVGLADDLVAVDVPANTVTKATNFTITPTSIYTAPSGKVKLAGTQVYDFTADVNGSTIKTFSKDLTLSFKYTADDIKGISETSLAVYYWKDATSGWVKVGSTVDTAARTVKTSVNHFTLFALMGEQGATAGQLIKLKCDASNKSICTAVYFVGNDGKRYVFPTEKTFYTWYSDFSSVKEVTATELASYKIGGNVTYRPGIKMVKIQSDPKVYVITKGGVLKEIPSEAVAKALYGSNWNKQIDDVPDAFFVNYKVGTKLGAAADYVISTEKSASENINIDKSL